MVLLPKSRYGKLFIEEYGADWNLLRRMDKHFSNKKPGPWAFIQQANGLKTTYVHLQDDKNFYVALGRRTDQNLTVEASIVPPEAQPENPPTNAPVPQEQPGGASGGHVQVIDSEGDSASH